MHNGQTERTYWDSFKSTYQMGSQKHRIYLLDKMKELGIEGFLDVGCGTGPLYELNKDYGFEYKGIDYSWAMVAIAKDTFPEGSFEIQDARKLKEPNNSWDAVVCMHTLDHLDDYKSAIQEMAKVARKYVIIILWRSFVNEGTNLNDRNMMGKKEEEEPWEDTHLQEYSKQVLEEAFEEAELTIQETAEGEQLNSDSSHYNFMFICRKR